MNNGKSIVAIAIAAIMMISVMTAIAPTAAAQEQPTLRLYGEDGAIYPTQSYTGVNDFIYPDPVDPFDPGIISKDSITFNPAYIPGVYEYAEVEDKAITVDGADSREKVFFRTFYEPEYWHDIDAVMEAEYPQGLDGFNENRIGTGVDCIVTETTYMLADANRNPRVGHAGGIMFTHFMLPVRSNTEAVPGMEDGDMVDLVAALNDSAQLTNGTIHVQQKYTNVAIDEWVQFMDHRIKFDGLNIDDHPLLDVEYTGNQVSVRDETKLKQALQSDVGVQWFYDRSNTQNDTTSPAYRWYATVTQVRGDEEHVDIEVGRVLVAGETFYVDGMRYDIPAIYVDDTDGFKYITLQTPIPKDPDEIGYTDTADWTHVTSQWLANLDMKDSVGADDNVWVLPPLNELHTIIDDIGLFKVDTNASITPYPGPDWEVPEYGLIIDGDKSPLEFYYTAETEEERFNTSLAERLNLTGGENWDWWSMYTKPIRYTELVLPNQETTTDTYEDTTQPDWYTFTNADGNEYLLTSSFIAPNCDDPERHNQSKATVEVHDIVDRAATIANPGDIRSREAYLNDPRVVFEYDAEDGTGIYVNTTGEVPTKVLTSVTLDPAGPPTLNVSDTQQFTATAHYNDSSTENVTTSATWESTNTTVGTISATGLFTALAEGTTTVTATYTYLGVTKSDTAVVTVTIELPKTGDIDGSGEKDIADAMYLAKNVLGMSGFETIYADGDVDSSGEKDIADAMYLAKNVLGMSGFEVLYP